VNVKGSLESKYADGWGCEGHRSILVHQVL
jgi:hypothetical protein